VGRGARARRAPAPRRQGRQGAALGRAGDERLHLAPSRELGQELARRTDLSGARVYPAFGSSAQDGHGGFATRPEGIAIWGPDVLSFFGKALAAHGAPISARH
jgi:hypothetical protein